jgi:hypothetical protein
VHPFGTLWCHFRTKFHPRPGHGEESTGISISLRGCRPKGCGHVARKRLENVHDSLGVKPCADDLWDANGNQSTNAASTVEGASAQPRRISGSVTNKLGSVERQGVIGSVHGLVEDRNSAYQIWTRQPKVLVARHNDTANESSSVEPDALRFKKGFIRDQAFNLRENRCGKRGERSGNYSGQVKQFVLGRKAKAFQLAERFLDCLRLKPGRSRENEDCELADPGEFQFAEKRFGPTSSGPPALLRAWLQSEAETHGACSRRV